MSSRPARRNARKRSSASPLFPERASRFNEDHVRLFDDVFGRLIAEIRSKARARAPIASPRSPTRRWKSCAVSPRTTTSRSRARCCSRSPPRRNRSRRHRQDQGAPAGHIRPRRHRRAGDRGAGPARRSRGRAHRGGRRARLSEDSFSALVAAEKDGVLAEKVGLRPDIPPRLFPRSPAQGDRSGSAAPVRLGQARDASRDPRVLARSPTRSRHATARLLAGPRTIEELRREKLDEAALVDFAKGRKYEETIAALASLCSVPIDVVDRLMGGDRPDRSHPLQVGRLGLADRQSRHHGTAERQGTVEPGARHRLFQFRAAVAGDRATRDAVLAIAKTSNSE